MSKNSFILYHQHYESIKYLNDEQLGRLFRAIFEYQINGVITQDQDILIAFMFIKNQLDIDSNKWEDIKQKRSEAGKRHNGNQYTKKMEQTEANGTLVPNVPTNGTNGSDNVNVNVNVNDNVINTIPTTSSSSSINIYDYIEKNFGRTLSPVEYEEVSKWENTELTRYAINQAVLNCKYNLKYISRIIDNYKKNGIITIQQAQAEEEQFKNRKGIKKSPNEILYEQMEKW